VRDRDSPATDEHGLPLGAVVTGANANDGVQTEDVLGALVLHPPRPERPNPDPDPLRVRADGAYGTARRGSGQPTPGSVWWHRAVVRRGVRASVGSAAPSSGGMRSCPNSVASRRFDRNDERYLGWAQLASAVIFIRHRDNGFFR
jgi:hypothetical protein